jgi:hypothetical protein
MRLGFTSIYAWRPHVAQMYYLARLAEQAGHETRFLACDSDLPTCYIRQMRPHRARLIECAGCRLGGIRSYSGKNVSSIGALRQAGCQPEGAADWVKSSASTLGRFESDDDFVSPAFSRFAEELQPAAEIAYSAARAWIEREKLDGIFLFNGRMDATRAVLEAAKDAKIPFVSMERTWLGDGIQLFPNEGCGGLANVDRMVGEWSTCPLSARQALTAASHIASRFLRRNQKEWRAYNVNAKAVAWPTENPRRRFLLLPGSRSEMWGHDEWQNSWPEPAAAYDALIAHFGIKPDEMVLRCHPNWGETIGRATGALSERYFTDWAKKRGVICIPSTDTISTMSLIEQCDAILVMGGSAALEAGALGKQVLALSPSWYQKAGFQTGLYGPDDLAGAFLHLDLNPGERAKTVRDIQKKTLRYCYTVGYRVAQFVPFVRCITTTDYDFFAGADPAQLMYMLRTGMLLPDDAHAAENETEEDEILALIAARDWEKLKAPQQAQAMKKQLIQRRHIFQTVDWMRSKLRRGDL